jgi:hypothetical protein
MTDIVSLLKGAGIELKEYKKEAKKDSVQALLQGAGLTQLLKKDDKDLSIKKEYEKSVTDSDELLPEQPEE